MPETHRGQLTTDNPYEGRCSAYRGRIKKILMNIASKKVCPDQKDYVMV